MFWWATKRNKKTKLGLCRACVIDWQQKTAKSMRRCASCETNTPKYSTKSLTSNARTTTYWGKITPWEVCTRALTKICRQFWLIDRKYLNKRLISQVTKVKSPFLMEWWARPISTNKTSLLAVLARPLTTMGEATWSWMLAKEIPKNAKSTIFSTDAPARKAESHVTEYLLASSNNYNSLAEYHDTQAVADLVQTPTWIFLKLQMGEDLLASEETRSQLTVVEAIETNSVLAKHKLNLLLTKRTTFVCLTSNSSAITIQAPPIRSTSLYKVGRFASEGIRPMEEAIALIAVAARVMRAKPAIPSLVSTTMRFRLKAAMETITQQWEVQTKELARSMVSQRRTMSLHRVTITWWSTTTAPLLPIPSMAPSHSQIGSLNGWTETTKCSDKCQPMHLQGRMEEGLQLSNSFDS